MNKYTLLLTEDQIKTVRYCLEVMMLTDKGRAFTESCDEVRGEIIKQFAKQELTSEEKE